MKKSEIFHWALTIVLLVIVLGGWSKAHRVKTTLEDQILGLEKTFAQHTHALIAKDKKGNPVVIDNVILSPEITEASRAPKIPKPTLKRSGQRGPGQK